MQKLVHQIYSFDEFTLDVTRGSCRRGVEEIKLRPKSFEVLKYLVENNGRLITKDELIQAMWTDTAVTDDSLVQCLKDIRHALGDKAQQIIKTVPRRGYIFEKEVRDNGSTIYTEETTGVHIVIEETEERNYPNVIETSMTRSGSFAPLNANKIKEQDFGKPFIENISSTVVSLSNTIKQHKRAAILILVVLVVFVSVVVLRFNSNKSNSKNALPMSVSLFQNFEEKSISHVGNIVNNAISPNGKFVVYTTTDHGRETLWLRQISTDSTHQIIAPADARYYGVTFSRDGEHIYYLRAENSNRNFGTLYRIPSPLGGIPEKVLDDMDWCPTFSPDGLQMAFVRSSDTKNESVMMIADADGGNERRLAVRPLNEAYDYPAWSPDGKVIAASAGSTELGDSFRDVVAVNVLDGTEKTLTTRKWYWTGTLAWLSDGSGLIMAANPEKSYFPNQLWLLSYPNGKVRQITNGSNNYTYLSFTKDSRILLAGIVNLLTHIWIAPEGNAARAKRITSGLGEYKDVQWTPDDKLAVVAFGGNHINIWLHDPDSNAPKQLTSNEGTNGGASFTPDGRYIVFDSDRKGDTHIWRMDADGSNPVQLTFGKGEKFPKISPDGKWVVYTSFPDWTLWKIPIEGGEPIKISQGYAREQTISPDGKWIAYTTFENDKYRWALIPFEGGLPVKKFEIPPNASQMQMVRFSPDSSAISFISTIEGVSNIWQQPIDGSPPKQMTNFNSDRIFSYDWSHDGKQLVLIRGAWTADMTLITQQ